MQPCCERHPCDRAVRARRVDTVVLLETRHRVERDLSVVAGDRLHVAELLERGLNQRDVVGFGFHLEIRSGQVRRGREEGLHEGRRGEVIVRTGRRKNVRVL